MVTTVTRKRYSYEYSYTYTTREGEKAWYGRRRLHTENTTEYSECTLTDVTSLASQASVDTVVEAVANGHGGWSVTLTHETIGPWQWGSGS